MKLVRVLLAACVAIAAQSFDTPDWQIAAGGKREFEVASVKPIPYELRHTPNFPLDNRNAFVPGGRFSAAFPLWVYITFAYKLPPTQQIPPGLPAWATNWEHDLYAVEARAAGNATKDQMRLMMQSLLADRFKLAVHFETQVVPVFALTLLKPGKTGPNLRPHSQGPPCPDSYADRQAGAGEVFPPDCDVAQLLAEGVKFRLGSRNTTMPLIAEAISPLLFMDKPVVDRTGLSGTFDFTVEYTYEPDAPPGTSLLNAVREQLGLKLVTSKAPIRILVIDHVERPSVN
jgi:uncharacterized protein (TIGR03435 family)